jgi:transposase
MEPNMQIHPLKTSCKLNISSAGGADLIRLLLMIIRYLSSCVEQTTQVNRQLAEENLELKVKLHKIARVFAPKNEQSAEPDGHNSQKPKRKRGAQPGRKPRSRNIPDQLPKQEVEVDFPEIPCCSVCGKQYQRESALDKISHQISTTISAVHQIITRHTYKKDCTCPGDKTIITAPQRKSVIKKSILATQTWVHLIMMKYLLAVPIYRYCQAVKPSGFNLSAATVENGFKKIGLLVEPVYQRLLQELRKSPVWNADETRWKVFETIAGKTSFLWWLWVFASQNVVLYVIDPKRSAAVIDSVNNGLNRIFAADRFSAYEAIKGANVLIAYCWVHLRRDFINLKSQKALKDNPAIGKWIDDWLRIIKMVFKLNNERLKTSSKKEFVRLTVELRAATEQLRQKTTEEVTYKFQKTILKSFKKRFAGYTLFIDNPEVPIHNNRAERLLKTGINGRKNYLGNVSQHSVLHTQIFLSIIATAKNNQVAPQKWFEDYLSACAENDSKPPQGADLEYHIDKLLNRPA